MQQGIASKDKDLYANLYAAGIRLEGDDIEIQLSGIGVNMFALQQYNLKNLIANNVAILARAVGAECEVDRLKQAHGILQHSLAIKDDEYRTVSTKVADLERQNQILAQQ